MLTITISPTIGNDYGIRGIFRNVPTGKARVTFSLPEQVLDDAEYQSGTGRHLNEGPDDMDAGIRRAYGALAKQIRRKFEEADAEPRL